MRKPLLQALTALSLAALVALLFSALGLGGDFILDDGINILQNHLLYVNRFDLDDFIYAALSFHDGNGSRSLPMLSFALDYWRSGSMDAAAFKITNVLIHGCTVFFLVFMLRRLLKLAGWNEKSAWQAALLLALAWGIHPMQVSSVLYIVQRMQTMATMFLVLALWAYLGMRQAQWAGQRGRLQGILTVVFWLLALLCKEDAALLLAYTLVLELTILHFRAGLPVVARGLRQSYSLMVALGLLVYVLVIVPHYWSWEAHVGRNFSTPERLLTQGRVLWMYIGQILLPWPDFLPFIYDSLPISRSLWSPWTTLPALLGLVALLGWSWHWRKARPLFACGVLLFFAGHFISSNVIALELVFEHRNHFPLIGALLAIFDLLCWLFERAHANSNMKIATSGVLLLCLALLASFHLYTWGDPVRHHAKLVALNQNSTRAWVMYGNLYFKRYNQSKNTELLQRALEITQQGLRQAPAPILAANIITYKSILDNTTDVDWQTLYQIMEDAPPGWLNSTVVQMLMANANKGFSIDPKKLLHAIEILYRKPEDMRLPFMEIAIFAYKAGLKEDAKKWFLRSAKQETAGSVQLERVANELDAAGYPDWAEQMRQINHLGK